MRRYLLAVTAAAVAAVALFTGTAAAQPDDDPVPGDSRATAHSENVVEKDCAELYKGSSAVALTHTVDDTNTYLDITAVPDDVEVVAVIVKGGPAYNEYLAGKLGALPWLDLHSPLVSSDEPAEISHWFACGVKETESTTTTTTTTTATTTTTTGSPAETTTTTPVSSSAAAVTTTTTSAAVAAAADEDDLASTGFNGGWLVALAAALLLAGGALLLLLRLRTSRR